MRCYDAPTEVDLTELREQLGRSPRGVRAVVFRCRPHRSEEPGYPGAAGPPESPSQVEALSQPASPGQTEAVVHLGGAHPGVVETEPRLPDGTPFPTLYYLTCPVLCAGAGRLESSGLMHEWTERLDADPDLKAAYRQAHEQYLQRREEIAYVPELAGISAGGMPDRVKCLHALVAHALAEGPGVNPLGDEALTLLGDHVRPE